MSRCCRDLPLGSSGCFRRSLHRSTSTRIPPTIPLYCCHRDCPQPGIRRCNRELAWLSFPFGSGRGAAPVLSRSVVRSADCRPCLRPRGELRGCSPSLSTLDNKGCHWPTAPNGPMSFQSASGASAIRVVSTILVIAHSLSRYHCDQLFRALTSSRECSQWRRKPIQMGVDPLSKEHNCRREALRVRARTDRYPEHQPDDAPVRVV